MSSEVSYDTVKIKDKDYYLFEALDDVKTTYYYFVNVENPIDIQIMKEKNQSDKKFFVSLESESEFDKALFLYYEKMKREE